MAVSAESVIGRTFVVGILPGGLEETFPDVDIREVQGWVQAVVRHGEKGGLQGATREE